jgi:hypothetical protein
MDFKKILWLEDQYEYFITYKSSLFRTGRVVDRAKSITEAIEKLRDNGKEYTAIIFDLKVIPGNDPDWIQFDQQQKKAHPENDPYLGLELLHSLFKPDEARIKLDPPISLSPQIMIVLSAVPDKMNEIARLGIPEDQIIYKAHIELETLPGLIEKIEEECQKSNI